MKNILPALLIIFFTACNSNADKTAETTNKSGSVTKNDLVKIKWITGNWRGMAEGKPFYEMYEMTNDSTIRITGYEWNGKDSAGTHLSYIAWNNGAYYLGDSLNYKTTLIDSSKIEMAPNYKANNSILFAFVNDSTWKAVLTGKKTVEYKMEKIPSISDMVKAANK